jgi:transcriptional regulator with XRE-family HTH domain
MVALVPTDKSTAASPGAVLADVGKAVRKLRNVRGWSQEELGRHAGGLNKETVNRLELGANTGFETVVRIVDALSVKLLDLFLQIEQSQNPSLTENIETAHSSATTDGAGSPLSPATATEEDVAIRIGHAIGRGFADEFKKVLRRQTAATSARRADRRKSRRRNR